MREGRDFLAWLEIERRNRSKKERDFREGRRITYEEGMKRFERDLREMRS